MKVWVFNVDLGRSADDSPSRPPAVVAAAEVVANKAAPPARANAAPNTVSKPHQRLPAISGSHDDGRGHACHLVRLAEILVGSRRIKGVHVGLARVQIARIPRL